LSDFRAPVATTFEDNGMKTLIDAEKHPIFAPSKRLSNNLKHNNKKIGTMKKNVFVLALFCIVSMMANAEVAKYCMSYDDFVAGNWKSVDELTAGRTQQVCQMKSGDHGVFYFKTGDKQSDELLKKDAFAVMYGQQLFVNCRNLRYKDVSLETSKYVQAVRYD
jgi:hypothetical protein